MATIHEDRRFASHLINFEDDDEPAVTQKPVVHQIPPTAPISSGDPVLEAMGRSFAEFTPTDLVSYFIERFKREHGYEYTRSKPGMFKEISIMRGLIGRVGAEAAGTMIQLAFDRHHGVWDRGPMTVESFAAGSKWIQDKLLAELHERRKTTASRQSSCDPYEGRGYGGMMDGADFLALFKS